MENLKFHSPNQETQRIWDECDKKNRESQIKATEVIAEFAKKISKERNELIEKTIASLPTKYEQIVKGKTLNLVGETKTPYFGCNNIVAGEFIGEYLFTTVEWQESTPLSQHFGHNITAHYKIIHEPQENIIFDKI